MRGRVRESTEGEAGQIHEQPALLTTVYNRRFRTLVQILATRPGKLYTEISRGYHHGLKVVQSRIGAPASHSQLKLSGQLKGLLHSMCKNFGDIWPTGTLDLWV